MPFPRRPLLWGSACLLFAAAPAHAGWEDALATTLVLDSKVPLTLQLDKVAAAAGTKAGVAEIPSGDDEDPIVIPLDPAEIPAGGDLSECSEWPFQGQERIRILVDVPGKEPSGIVYLRLLAKGDTVCGLAWHSKGGTGSWAVRRDLPNKAFLSVMDGEATVTYPPDLKCGNTQAARNAGGEKAAETKAGQPVE